MGSRGRKTDADKAMLIKHADVNGLDYPPAPDWMSEDAQEEWNAIVITYPADRFPRSTWPMLEAYCTHAVNVRKISRMINNADENDFNGYGKLLSWLNRETKTLASFGVRLGIARTSMAGRHNDDPETTRTQNQQPWEDT